MALKILKVNVPLVLKGDPQDPDDLRNRVFETLALGIEGDDLEFVVEEDEDDAELEE